MKPRTFTFSLPDALWALALTLPMGCAGEPSPDPTPPDHALFAPPDVLDDDACGGPPPGDGKVLEVSNGGWDGFALSSDRIVTSNYDAWALWDRTRGKRLATGTIPQGESRAALADDTMIAPIAGGFELRETRDGTLRASVSYGSSNRTASGAFPRDGRYIYAIYESAVQLWDLRGSPLLQHAAQIQRFQLHAGRDVLRIAPSGTQRIEEVNIATGASHTSAATYTGDFLGWFLDGSHFMTGVWAARTEDVRVHVYKADATFVQAVSVPSFYRVDKQSPPRTGGDGEHVWVYSVEGNERPRVVRVYRLGETTPVRTFNGEPVTEVSHSTMPVFFDRDRSRIQTLDLRGDVPIFNEHVFYGGINAPRYARADADGRIAYMSDGLLYDEARPNPRGAAQQLGCGELTSLTAAPGRIAISTNEKITRIYTLRGGTPVLTAKIANVLVRQAMFSADGRVLYLTGKGLATNPGQNDPLYAYEIDVEGRVGHSTSVGGATIEPYVYYAVAANGARVARTDCVERFGTASCYGTVYENGQPLLRLPSVPTSATLLLSPSGRHAAQASAARTFGPPWTNVHTDLGEATRIDGVEPWLWLDDEHLLVRRPPDTGAEIVDRTGKLVAHIAGPLSQEFRLGTSQRMHDGESVYSTTDGKLLWNLTRDAGRTRDKLSPSALAGDQFVFVQGQTVRLETVRPIASEPTH